MQLPTGVRVESSAAAKDHGLGWWNGNYDPTAKAWRRRFQGGGVQNTYTATERQQWHSQHHTARHHLQNTQGWLIQSSKWESLHFACSVQICNCIYVQALLSSFWLLKGVPAGWCWYHRDQHVQQHVHRTGRLRTWTHGMMSLLDHSSCWYVILDVGQGHRGVGLTVLYSVSVVFHYNWLSPLWVG